MTKEPLKRAAGATAVMLALLAVTFVMVMPYLWMAVSAFKTNTYFYSHPTTLLFWADKESQGAASPAALRNVTLINFAEALDPRTGRMGRYLFNSLFYATIVTIFQLFFNSLAAFAFARLKFKGRDAVFTLFLATMMLPGAVRLVPEYLVAVKLGLADSLPGVVLPNLAGVFGIFLLRQFFLNIPRDLEDAAAIDGAGVLGIYWRIILPLAKPALITLGIFVFMAEWNNFVWPLVILSDWDKYPVTVGISLFRDEGNIFWPKIFAASVMGSAPLIALFLVAQKYIIGGIALSGMKAQ